MHHSSSYLLLQMPIHHGNRDRLSFLDFKSKIAKSTKDPLDCLSSAFSFVYFKDQILDVVAKKVGFILYHFDFSALRIGYEVDDLEAVFVNNLSESDRANGDFMTALTIKATLHEVIHCD